MRAILATVLIGAFGLCCKATAQPRPITLSSKFSQNGKLELKVTSEATTKKSETTIEDQILNYRPTSAFYLFHKNDSGMLMAASLNGTTIKPALLMRRWNTFSKVREASLNPLFTFVGDEQPVRITAGCWIVEQPSAAATDKQSLFGVLVFGKHQEAPLVRFQCHFVNQKANQAVYRFVVENHTDRDLAFEWAGFKETLASKKSFLRDVEGKLRRIERKAAAHIVFADKTEYALPAHYWDE